MNANTQGVHVLRRLSVLLVAAMSASSVAGQTWTSQRILELRDPNGAPFGAVTSIAVRPDGGFYVLDGQEARVVQFSPDGRMERAFGRYGAGPGELSRLAKQLLLVGPGLAVVDPGNQRLSLFRLDGSFLGTQALTLTQALATGWAVSGDRLACITPPVPGGFGFDETGPDHTLWAVPLGAPPPADPLLRVHIKPGHDMAPGASVVTVDLSAPTSILATGTGGVVLLAVSDSFRIRVVDPTGRETALLRRDVAPRRYSAAEKNRLRQQADSGLRRAMAAGAAAAGGAPPAPRLQYLLPEVAPAVVAVVGGDEFVLVGRGVQDQEAGALWDILHYDGRFLGSVTLPSRFTALAAVGNRIWGVERTPDEEEIAVVFDLLTADQVPSRRSEVRPGR